MPYWFITVKVIELGKFFLVQWKVLKLFVNTSTVDHKYSLLTRDNSMQTIQMHFSRNQNIFSEFFAAFLDSTLNFDHFLKKQTLIAYVFPKLPSPKDVVRKMCKNSCFGGPSTGSMVNGPKHWFNLNASIFTILIDHCQGN